VRDRLDDPAAMEVQTLEARRGKPMEIAMRPAGGVVVRFSK
jgi:hypothetical protein